MQPERNALACLDTLQKPCAAYLYYLLEYPKQRAQVV